MANEGSVHAAARGNLSDDLVAVLRDLVVDGDLPAGERLNEVHLAARLEVSRTPLREALIRLVGDGFIEQKPRRGFFVRPLVADEVADLYRIRHILDPAALELAGLPPASRIDELRGLNRAIEAADAPRRIIELDEAWHRLLLAHCPNPILLAEIDRFMERTRRYEHAYFRSTRHVEVATREHERILDALQDGALDVACRRLARNLESAVEPLVTWLRRRDAGSPLVGPPSATPSGDSDRS